MTTPAANKIEPFVIQESTLEYQYSEFVSHLQDDYSYETGGDGKESLICGE